MKRFPAQDSRWHYQSKVFTTLEETCISLSHTLQPHCRHTSAMHPQSIPWPVNLIYQTPDTLCSADRRVLRKDFQMVCSEIKSVVNDESPD